MTDPPLHAQTFTREAWEAMTPRHRDEVNAARRLIVAHAKQEHWTRYHAPRKHAPRRNAA